MAEQAGPAADGSEPLIPVPRSPATCREPGEGPETTPPPTPPLQLPRATGHHADPLGCTLLGTSCVLMVFGTDQWAVLWPLHIPLPLHPPSLLSEAAQARLGVPESCL